MCLARRSLFPYRCKTRLSHSHANLPKTSSKKEELVKNAGFFFFFFFFFHEFTTRWQSPRVTIAR